MKKLSLVFSVMLILVMVFSGYQCSSTELTSAKLYIQQKNLDKALEALNKEVEKNPKSDEGYYLMGYVYGEKEQTGKMIDAYTKSLSISKKYEKDINAARKSFWANFFNRGVGFFNRAVSSTNEDSSKMYFERSIFAFDQAVLAEPDSPDTYKNMAFVYMNLQKYDDAIPPLKKIIELENSLDGYKFLGEIYYNKGQMLQSNGTHQDSVEAKKLFVSAVEVLQEGKKFYPDDADILLFLSNSYIAADKIDVAIDAFKAGVEKDPKNKFYRYNYGVLLLGANEFEQAAEQFRAAIELDSKYENAIYNLAVTYVKWGAKLGKEAEDKGVEATESKDKYRLSLPHLEAYVGIKTDDIAVWELLGKVYSVLGMLDDAQKAFDKADAFRK